jgi:hypothetical protein
MLLEIHRPLLRVFISKIGSIACANTSATSSGILGSCASHDTCQPDNLCHFTHTQASSSSFYVASCTDLTHKDLACRPQHSKFLPRLRTSP